MLFRFRGQSGKPFRPGFKRTAARESGRKGARWKARFGNDGMRGCSCNGGRRQLDAAERKHDASDEPFHARVRRGPEYDGKNLRLWIQNPDDISRLADAGDEIARR